MTVSMRVGFLLVLGVICGQPVGAEDVKQVEGRVLVEYEDGSLEHYVVRWTGAVLSDRRESGGPATPLSGKWIDDRQCHWVVRTVVSRRLYLKARSGEEFERPESAKLFESSEESSQEKSASGFRAENVRPENCNDAEAKILGDLEGARARAAATLDEVVKEDRKRLPAQLKEVAGVRKASFEAAEQF
jgi:hypothetical protein